MTYSEDIRVVHKYSQSFYMYTGTDATSHAYKYLQLGVTSVGTRNKPRNYIAELYATWIAQLVERSYVKRETDFLFRSILFCYMHTVCF